MIYLFFGQNYTNKDQKIQEIKKKLLSADNSEHFDFDQLDGTKLSAEDLKKSLVAMPAVLKQRVVLIRKIEKLSTQNKDLLLNWIKEKNQNCVLLLDSDEGESKNAFLTKLSANAQVFSFAVGKGKNVFDMTRALSSRNDVEALKILDELLEAGDHPLQIMGGLVWFWGKQKGIVAKAKFEEGLEILQEADLNIKRSRLKPEYAIELLVVKLAGLL